MSSKLIDGIVKIQRKISNAMLNIQCRQGRQFFLGHIGPQIDFHLFQSQKNFFWYLQPLHFDTADKTLINVQLRIDFKFELKYLCFIRFT